MKLSEFLNRSTSRRASHRYDNNQSLSPLMKYEVKLEEALSTPLATKLFTSTKSTDLLSPHSLVQPLDIYLIRKPTTLTSVIRPLVRSTRL